MGSLSVSGRKVYAGAPTAADGGGRLLRMSADGFDPTQGRVASARFKGVSVARRRHVNPPWATTSRKRASPAGAPRQEPTACEREAGMR